jgi:hypothetical protein
VAEHVSVTGLPAATGFGLIDKTVVAGMFTTLTTNSEAAGQGRD